METAVRTGNCMIAIQSTDGGYDYTVYREDYTVADGGVIENDEITMEQALADILDDAESFERLGLYTGECIGIDYDTLMERVDAIERQKTEERIKATA